ncbi:MAG: FISUMP domain-containing protein [Fibrobacter sp.]|uniref:FISUMP domain-containing protein n=1 Tax=Fibrobacter sp. TaxID=35828 RepID=UPI002A916030|nr:FISUMP domain-containing protein [Fibrobacter sp.]MDY6263116.1 FISUMP domain-containing protein [Fibrobacter sp.]
MNARCLFLGLAVMAALTIAACDDSSSGAGPDPVAEVSSSSGDLDNAISSSSVTDKGISSGGGSRSSSSVSGKNSSSSVVKSSSSFSIVDWHIPCEGGSGIWEIDDEKYVCEEGFLVPYIPPSSSSSSSAKTYPYKDKFKEDSVFNEEKSYGTFKDPRDGQEYRTIVIKTGYVSVPEFEVFAQNLNYGTQIKLGTSVFDDDKVERFCYDDDPWYCEHYFGGLYSWSETFGHPRACDSVWTGTTPNCPDSIAKGIVYESDWEDLQIQGICPEGWHVMNETEWRAMIGADESAYRATSKASNGSNGNGFSALFGGGGYDDDDGCRFDNIGKYAQFWLPMETAYHRARVASFEKSSWDYISFPKVYGLSVRCVKDYTVN